jgi:hypothetical protein
MPVAVQGIEFSINGSANNATNSVEHLVNVLVKVKDVTNSTTRSTSRAARSFLSLSSVASKLAKTLSLLRTVGRGALKVLSFSAPLKSIKSFMGALSSLGNMFKRVLLRMAIRAAIKAISQAFKDGVENLYAWSAALGGNFAASMDRIATSMQYFKNSAGAMVAPLINALAPALDYIIDKAVDLMNVINQLFARLTGASYWTKAIKVAKSYGDAATEAAGSAGQAAKEALRYLAPFDELNVLPSDSGSGGGSGGGSGSGGAGGSGMFEEMVQFDSSVSDFASKLKEAWENADFTEIGGIVGEKLKGALDSIQWDNIKESCNRIAQSLATFINGFVSTPGIWTSIGKTIGEGVNTAVGAWNTFFDTTNFDDIGEGISEALNTIFNPESDGYINPTELGRALSQKIKAIFDLAYGFLVGDGENGGFDFTNFGTWIGDVINGFFENLELDKAAESLNAAVGGIFDTVTAAAEEINWGEIGNNIKGFFATLETTTSGFSLALGAILALSGVNVPLGIGLMAVGAAGLITAGVVKWSSLESPVQKAASAIGAAVGGALLAVGAILAFSGISTPLGIALMASGALSLGVAVTALNWNQLSIDMKSRISTIAGIVGEALLAVGALLAFSGVATPLGLALMAAGAVSLGTVVALNWGGMDKDVKQELSVIGGALSGALLVVGALLAFSGVGLPLGLALMGVGATGLTTTVALNWDAIVDKVNEVADNIHTAVEQKWNLLKLFFSDVVAGNLRQTFIDIGNGAIGAVNSAISTITSTLSETKFGQWLAEKLGLDSLEEIKIPLIADLDPPPGTAYQNYKDEIERDNAKKKIALDAKGEVKEISTDSLKDEKLQVKGMTGQITKATDGIPLKERQIADMTAEYTKSDDKLSDSARTVKATAKYTSSALGLKVADRTISTKAKYTSTSKASLTDAQKTISTTSKYTSAVKTSLTDNQKTISTTSRYTGATDALTAAMRTISTTASFNYSKYGDRWTVDDSTFSSVAKFTTSEDALTSYYRTISVVAKIEKTTGALTVATGGVYSGGAWHNIAQYASGGLARGSQLFWAREAGPELVGTLGSHTAVMNNDQIVASVSAGVARAVAGIHFKLTGLGSAAMGSETQMGEEALYRAFVRAINDTNLGDDVIELDGNVVYQSMVNRNRQNTRMTGVNALATT